MRFGHLIICLPLALFICASTFAAAMPEVKAVQIEGEDWRGAIQEVSADDIKINGKLLAYNQLVKLEFPSPIADAAPTAPSIFIRNGSVLTQAAIVSGSDSLLKLKTPTAGDLDLDIKQLDRIIFYGAAKKMPDGLDAFTKLPAPKEDLLFTLKGDTVSGFFEKFSEKDVSFNSNGQSRAYPFEQLAAVRLAALEKLDVVPGMNALVVAINGSRLVGKLKGLDDGKVVLETAGGTEWKINGYQINAIEFSGGRMVYLSSLEPIEVDQKPYVGGVPVVFTWRKDRSSGGTPMKIGDVSYDKGLGVHSYCRLAYELNGAYAKFACDVGVDASVPGGSVCDWRVLVDGKEVAAGSAKANGEKVAVNADVTNANKLELICDYGNDNDDAGDRLNFAKARLIKP